MAYKINSFCRKCSLIAAFLLLLQHTFAQADFSSVDRWMDHNISSLGGRAVLVIYKDGQIVYDKAENDLGPRQKMIGRFLAKKQGKVATDSALNFTDSSKEPIASCSKWLSAALVMTFVDEGKLNLDDSIGKYLPIMNQYGKGGIKIKYCLSHLTGIKSESLKDSREIMSNSNSMDDAIKYIAKLPMEGKPGKTFHYSSAGLQILAAILEKISGKDFNTLFEERIAKHCNMVNTDFGDEKVPLAAGSAWSTPKDYLNFLVMILNDGKYNGKQVLSKEAVSEMQKNRITKDVIITYTPDETEGWGYGYGEWTMDDATGDTRSDEISSAGLYGSFPWADNRKHYAAFLFTFNINTEGRKEKYTKLKGLIENAFQ
jgi:CubicO group peptidase (beta-lactamase class C family)